MTDPSMFINGRLSPDAVWGVMLKPTDDGAIGVWGEVATKLKRVYPMRNSLRVLELMVCVQVDDELLVVTRSDFAEPGDSRAAGKWECIDRGVFLQEHRAPNSILLIEGMIKAQDFLVVPEPNSLGLNVY